MSLKIWSRPVTGIFGKERQITGRFAGIYRSKFGMSATGSGTKDFERRCRRNSLASVDSINAKLLKLCTLPIEVLFNFPLDSGDIPFQGLPGLPHGNGPQEPAPKTLHAVDLRPLHDNEVMHPSRALVLSGD